MYDSIQLDNLPDGADLYAGYDDGNWPDASAIKARFPNKTVLRVTVFPWDNEGDMLDVETGDAKPLDAPAWVQRRRASGHGGPLVYCNFNTWPSLRWVFHAQAVPDPGYVVAGYPGPPTASGPVIPPGAVGHQYEDRGPYDVSAVVDYLPGIDPLPPAKETATVKFLLVTYEGGEWIVGFGPSGPWKHPVADPQSLSAFAVLGAEQAALSAAQMLRIPTIQSVPE